MTTQSDNDRAAAVAALATLDAIEAMRRNGWLVVLKAGPDYGRAWRCDAIRHDVYLQFYYLARTMRHRDGGQGGWRQRQARRSWNPETRKSSNRGM